MAILLLSLERLDIANPTQSSIHVILLAINKRVLLNNSYCLTR